MNFIDMRTIVFSYILSNAVCMLVMALLWLRNRNRFAGLGFWLADFAMQFVVILLVALRGVAPDFLSIVVSNALVIAGTILLLIGLERFVGSRFSQLHNYFLLGAFILIHTYFTFVQPNLLVRTINLAAGIILVCAQCAWLLINRVDASMRPITRGVGYIFVTFCLVSLARITALLAVNPGNDFFQSGPFEALATLTNQMLFIILTVGLLLMVNRQLVAEMESDIAGRKQVEGALQRSEALLLQTSKMAKVGGWELDLQTMTPHWSLETYRIHEVDPSLQPDLGNAINFYAPEARPVISEAVQRAIEQGQSYDLELPFVTARGRSTWVRTMGEADLRDGKCVRLFGTFQDITEQKQAEEGLRRYELLSEHSRDIILFLRGEDGQILEANTAAVQAYGYNRDELLALTLQDLRAPDTRSLTSAQMAKANAGGILFETVHLRKDGSTFPVEVSSQGATIGGVRTLVSIVRDISERKQAKEEITSLSKFPTENPYPILRVQNDGRVTYANTASQELLEMWGCETGSYLPEELKELITVTVDTALDKTVDIPCNDKVYSITLVPIVDGGYVNLYGSDTTARKRAEQALLESEEKYRLLADNANDWIYWIRPDRSFQYVSPSCERFTGFTLQEFKTNPRLFTEIIHPEDRERVESHLAEVREGDETHNLDYRIITKSNDVRWISHSCDPVYTPDGKYMGRNGTNRDITERKRAEEALRISEERFRFALANSPIIVANLDRQLRYTWVYNPLAGFKPEDLIGKTVGLSTDPETKAKILTLLEEVLMNGTSAQWETTVRTDDGEKFFQSQAEPLRASQGEITGITLLSIDITERKQAEEKVQRSEAMLRAVLNQMPSGVTVRDARSGELILSNTRSQEIMRTLVDTPAHFDHYRGFHPDGSPYRNEDWPLSRSIATGEVVKAEEINCKRSDETWITLSINTAPIRDLQGQIVMGVGVFDDITERKQAEEEILASKAKLDAALESMSDAVFISDTDGRFIEFNEAFATFHKFKSKKECAKTLGEYPEFLDVFKADRELAPLEQWAVPRALRGETGKNVEYFLYRKDTGEAWVGSYSFAPIRDNTGAIVGSVVVSRDITEQKLAEEQRIKLAKRLGLATRSARMGIWDWDIKKNELFWDDQMYALYGLKPSEFGGAYEAWLNGIHPDDRDPSNEVSQQALRGEREYDTEFRIVRPDASVHWLKANGEVFRDELGRPLRMVGVNYDITDRKQAEEELKRTLEELKHSNAELEEFAYVASHDLQEPLRGIAGLVQLLQRRYQGQLDSRADEYIGHIVEGTQRMQTLINDLLAYSRVGRRGEAIQPTETEAALKTALKNLDAAILGVGANITNDSLPKVKADATQLIQLFQNLIGNALKFRGEYPPQIHIGVADAGDCWQFSVQDNGIGIEPQYFERIFQVFQRLHTRREYQGTGIGLAICKKIIERHGGHIWVASEKGQGSTFYFTLPKG